MLVSLVLATVSAAEPPRRFALVVGSNEGLPSEAPLRYAAADADRFAEALVRVGDVRAEDLVLLRNPDARSVGRALDALGVRTERVPDSMVIVFYSGHASAHALHIGGTQVALAPLVDRMAAMESQVELLVVDACGSGSLTRRKGVVPAEPFQIALGERLDTEGMAILTSSSPGEDAQESEHLQGGVFTHHLVTGLLGAADGSGDGLVTLTEAFRYGYDQTVRTTSVAPVLQHPAFDIRLSGKQDLVVARVDDRAGSRLRLEWPGTWLILGGRRGALVAEVDVQAPVALALPPGGYLLRRRHDGLLSEAEATLVRGAETRLMATEMRRVSTGETVRKGYDPERGTAGAILLGAGLAGPFGVGTGTAAMGQVGLRLDTRALSFGVRIGADRQRSIQDEVERNQLALGGALSVVRLQHLVRDRLLVGIGLRAGVDVVNQWFVTPGQATPRAGAVGYLGSVVRAETTLASRWIIGVRAGVDALAFERLDETRTTVVRPFGGLEVGAYVW
ncbi:MAG: caspase family protein [Myxococcota bacterium]